MKAIWIDVDNSPHVPLFTPLIKHYRENGVEIILTARNHSQTVELLEDSDLNGTFKIIGKHYGKTKINKIYGLARRTVQLVSYLKKVRRDFDVRVAVSHGSRSMVLAARWLKIPVISMYDYEFTETLIFNRFSDKVLIPEKIPDEILDEIGLPAGKRVKYRGLKEELYLNYFESDPNFRSVFSRENKLEMKRETILIALRPPAATANYHNQSGDIIFRELLKYLLSNKNILTIISPRNGRQKVEIENLINELKLDLSGCRILEKAVRGLDLIRNVDLLISGGGTMNREAVLLGTKVYSIFAGRQGAVDSALEKEGLPTFIRHPNEVRKIRLEKPAKKQGAELSGNVEEVLRRQINERL